jgi:hypothetical protein
MGLFLPPLCLWGRFGLGMALPELRLASRAAAFSEENRRRGMLERVAMRMRSQLAAGGVNSIHNFVDSQYRLANENIFDLQASA